MACCPFAILQAEQFGLFTYEVIDGTEVEITDYPATEAGPVVVPAEIDGKPVTSIGDNAFHTCMSLTSITLPESVAKLGSRSFMNCFSLTSLTLPAAVTSIGEHAFESSFTLASINIPEGVTSIANHTFSGCSSLTSIVLPETVTSIGNSAFSGCFGLASIDIPVGVTTIAASTFHSCSSLTSIDIPNAVTSIGKNAFLGCSRLAGIDLPDGIISISDFTFYDCSSLTNINIPDSVTDIGARAFDGCTSLASITIPEGVTSIASSSFQDCSRLTSVAIPSGVTTINSSTFSGCTSLTSVLLPHGVTSIGSEAFLSCTSLASFTMPFHLTSVLYRVFADCSSLATVTFTGNAPILGSDAFSGTAANFEVRYHDHATGFTAPTWQGYPAVNVGPAPFALLGVEMPSGTPLAEGAGISFSGLGVGASVARSITLRNVGGETLTGITVTVTSLHGDFTVGQPSTQSLEPGETTTFEATFTRSVNHPSFATLLIASNDPYQKPYTVNLTAGTGLEVKIYDTEFGSHLLGPISNLRALTPDGVAIQEDFSISSIGDFASEFSFVQGEHGPALTSNDTFSILWEGWFDVTREGVGDYTFGTSSDDGSVLCLDLNGDGDFSDGGEQIVDNNGDHPPQSRTGEVTLHMDAVRIAIAVYEHDGGQLISAGFRKGSGYSFYDLARVSDGPGHFSVLPPGPNASAANLWNFGIPGYPAVMNGTDIVLNVPETMDLTSLAPVYKKLPSASCDKPSGSTHDFSTPRTYTVTSEDSLTTRAYTVTVVASPTWISDHDGSWSDIANWSGGNVADGSGVTTDFSTIDITADRNVGLDSGRTLENLIFGDISPASAGGWTLEGGALSLSGASPSIRVNTLGAGKGVTIASGIINRSRDEPLIKSGPGTLNLTGSISSRAGIFIQDGMLRFGGARHDTRAWSSLKVNNHGILAFNYAANVTGRLEAVITDELSGPGMLVQEGPGTVVLNGPNFCTGGTIVNGGILAVNGRNETDRLIENHPVTINGVGSVFEIRGDDALPTYNDAVDFTVNAGGTLRVVSSTRAHIRNISLSGGSVWQGEHISLAGDILVSGTEPSEVVVDPGIAIAVRPGVEIAEGGSITVEDVTGDDRADFVTDCVFQGAMNLVKEGPGTMVLGGDSTYSGFTEINEGTLLVNGTLGPGGQGVKVRGTTLGGAGTVQRPVLVSNNGRITPGSEGAGALTVEALTISSGTSLDFTPGATQLTVANASGFTANGGPDSVILNLGTEHLLPGTHRLISYSGSIQGAGFAAFRLGTIPPGYVCTLLDNQGSVDVEVVRLVPHVVTGLADGIDRTSATLHGLVDPSGFASTARFEYGLTTAYGNAVAANLSPDDGVTLLEVAATLQGLEEEAIYHYRLTASNQHETSVGEDQVFATERIEGDYRYTTAGNSATLTGYTGGGGDLAVPSSINGLQVTGIGPDAFADRPDLTSVMIPAGITSIGRRAFRGCGDLAFVIFAGDAPTLGDEVFLDAAPGFTVYFLRGNTGFTSPTWEGYSAVEIDQSVYPAAIWLLTHGIPYDTDLDQDLNGDGVSLQMAYALDLDPNLNLAGRLPEAVLGPVTLSMTFYAVRPGITYVVLTSTDLQNWATEGVSWSAPDPDGRRTASVVRDGPRRFLRLFVTASP